MTTTGTHYTVLARRFRPQAFDDVVGQEHVARALTNAIRTGRVAHAYMFTGARGVGKTSTARILAKALNCPHATDGVPCNQCEICDGISAGNDVDVLEIDGASNRGIDDIRSLRANVGVRSMRTPFKVYIIDEVHMLTKEAFNALLKTLEEPPPNVKFVFCTTEPTKVPDTILSRCQRFDFSSIDDRSIAGRLREIAAAEGFQVSEDALELVARRARGSMRDSQSVFDQLLAFSTGEVSADDVHRLLGTAPDEQLLELFQAIAEHRPGEVLTLVDRALGAGVQPGELLNQSISYVRDWMVTLSGGGQVPLASVAARHRGTLQSQAAAVGMTTALAAFQILAHAANQMFRSTFARIVLEMALVQLSLLENLSALSDLLSGRLTALPAGGSGPYADSAAGLAGDGKKKLEPLTPDEAPLSASTRRIPAPIVSDEPAVTAPAPIVMELTPGDCPELLDALLAASGLRGATGLKQAEGLRFTPPNVLEILLPASGEFARKVLEQPDIRGRLESEASRLTGRRMAILLKTVSGDAPAGTTSDVVPAALRGAPDATQPVSPSAAPETVERRPVSVPTTTTRTQPVRRDATPALSAVDLRGQVDPMQDPFVRQVIEVFGATPVRITTAPVIRDAESGDA